jgi:YD repeat-containing protein
MSRVSRRFPSSFVAEVGQFNIRRLLTNLLLPTCLTLLCHSAAQAQFNCPPPWASATNVYGIVTLEGSGTGSSGDFTQTVDQHAVAAGKLAGLGQGSCAWQAIPQVGFGQMKSQANENDTVTYNPNGTFINWSASGAGDPLWDSISLEIIPSTGQYVVGAFGAVPGKLTTNSGTTNEDIIWGAASTSGGVSEPNQPFPPSASSLFGTASYQAPPLDNAQGNPGLINANWTASWLFTPVPDGTCKDCEDKRGSQVSVRNQSLGEDIAIVGTPFSLHYESQRTPGRAGADLFAVKDALSLGGWTLSVHHVLEPLLMVYCAGGSCTPYSIVPKALFLGDGSVRNSSEVQTPLVVGSNLQVTSEDGSEIYVFAGASGKHIQTLLPMTGAVLYNFGYDANGLLITVTDGSGNVTTIQRDVNGHPTAIVSPYGQTTTLSVDANGYLSQVTDPMGKSVKLTNTALGLLTSFTDPNGNLHSFQYDGNGFLTKDSDPAAGVINLARTDNASGYSVTETTAQGRSYSGVVAFSNTSTSTTQAYTNTWPNGLQATLSETQQNGQRSLTVTLPYGASYSGSMGPDPRWGIQLPIAASQTVTRGNLTMSIAITRSATLANPADPFSLTNQTDTVTINGNKYTSVFTGANKTFVDTTPAGRAITTVLDSLERISSIQPTGLALTTYSYENRGRLSSILKGTRTTTLAYDASGNLATVTNPLNLTRGFSYDAGGRMSSMTLEDGRVINYTYDGNGNLTSITPPGAAAHSYSYGTVNLPASYTPPVVPGGGATTYTYSPDRELSKMTRPDGEVVNYNYDTAGRLSSLATPSATIGYVYNSTTGNLSTASVSGGETITYSYNGPLPTVSTWAGTVAGSVSRAYNNNFWVTSESINGGNSVAFTYN